MNGKIGPAGASLALILLACGPDSPAAVKSLAGASKLPALEEVAEERMLILLYELPEDGRALNQLTVTLNQDNSVKVERTSREWSGWPTDGRKPVVLYSETHKASSESASRARSELSLLHPEKLGSEFPTAVPEGCQFVHDQGSTASVLFFAPRGRIGVFDIQPSCESPAVPKAEAAIRAALIALGVDAQRHGFSI